MNNSSCPSTGQLISAAMEAVNDPNCSSENVSEVQTPHHYENTTTLYQDSRMAQLEQQIVFLQQQSHELQEIVKSQQEVIYSFQQSAQYNMQGNSNITSNQDLQEKQSDCNNSKRKRLHERSSDQSTPTELRPNVPIQNSFAPLSDLEDDKDLDNNSSNSENISIPPINIPKSANILQHFSNFISDIKSIISNDFETKVKNSHISIFFKTIMDFRSYRAHCDSKNIPYFTYRDPTNKTLSAIMFDVPLSYSNEEIKTELLKNFPIISVYRLFGKNRESLESCALELYDNDQGKDIIKLNKLFNSIVKVKFKNKISPIQCKNCQRFNHTQANCRMEPRCVRCTDNHHYSKCNKPKTTIPKCVNCFKNHTANYRGCPVFMKNSSKNQNPNNQIYTQSKTKIYTPHNSKISYQTNNTCSSVPAPNIQNTKHFPRLPTPSERSQNTLHHQYTSSNNKYNDITSIIPIITSQIINAIIPQIQNLIQQILPNYIYNGPQA